VRIELGAPIVVVDLGLGASHDLYHLPSPDGGAADGLAARTLCGLRGPVFLFTDLIRRRRACAVCRAKAPRRIAA
jgi:hypothetical protein